ncbi:MAG: hypothetical protein SV253_05220 [Halobacteria archaeon]|nr:hypothetical protein [Halobacteria archaeon]
MSTSIKIDEETKSKIEELQAKIKLETGEKATQEEILEGVVSYALSTEEDIIDSFRDKTVPLSDEEIEEFHGGTSNWDEDLKENDLDEVLYG